MASKNRHRENTCTTLHKVFDYATTNYAKHVAYQYVDGGQKYTYEDFRRKVEQLSLRMTRFGIKHGDRVAIFSIDCGACEGTCPNGAISEA